MVRREDEREQGRRRVGIEWRSSTGGGVPSAQVLWLPPRPHARGGLGWAGWADCSDAVGWSAWEDSPY